MGNKDMMPAIGIFSGAILIIWAITLGGSLKVFWDYSSAIIVIFGSFAALVASFPFKNLKQFPVVMKQAFKKPMDNRNEITDLVTSLSRKARSEGLLSLEDELENIEDKFFGKGLQMVIDGIEPENISKILELEIDAMERRHGVGHSIFRTWSELAPAYGMIGTLIGLILMLSKLDDASAIGAGMAVALITTFYGAVLANLVFIPIANKLETLTENEIFTKEMIIEGLLSIQAGLNPRIVEEKLITFLSPKERFDRLNQGEKNVS